MSSLEDIANAKVQAAVTRRLDSLTPAIVSIKQEMNGRGCLHSSMTVTEIHKKSISLFDEIRNDMKIEYGMMLDNALWPTESLGDRLISQANKNPRSKLRGIAMSFRAQRGILTRSLTSFGMTINAASCGESNPKRFNISILWQIERRTK